MPLLKITRTIKDVSGWDEETKAAVAGKSNGVVAELFPNGDYVWKTSVVAGPDTLVCYHDASDEAAVRAHSKAGGFPVDSVEEVGAIDMKGALWTMGPENAQTTEMARAAE